MREVYPAAHVLGLSVAGVVDLAGHVQVVHGDEGGGSVADAAVAAVGHLYGEATGVFVEHDQEIQDVAVGCVGIVGWNKF